jgi:CheY-like chemotaxis protein
MSRRPLRLVLIEDNDDDILLLEEAIAKTGLLQVLKSLADPDDALAYLRRQGPYRHAPRPDVVLLDINMPKRDGFQILEELKADAALRHLPVVILTTSQEEQDVVRAYALGACSFICKPVGIRELRELIERLAVYWGLVVRVPQS